MAFCYICSPRRGNFIERIRNRKYARWLTREAIRIGYTPITPHLYLTQALDDKDPDQRQAGLKMGLCLLDVCDYMLVGTKYGINAGMQAEIEKAVRNRTFIEYWR